MARGGATCCRDRSATARVTRHDFGLINEADGSVRCLFVLINTGDEPLSITRTKSTCGCTTTGFPRDEIMPGDSAAVEVTYSPRGVVGTFDKSVFVYTTGDTRRTQLSVTGTVHAAEATIAGRYPLQAGPMRLSTLTLPMGEHTRGEVRNKIISVYNPTLDTLVLTPLVGDNVHIVARAVPERLAPGTTATVTFIYNTRIAPMIGFNSDEVLLRCDSVGVTTDAPITVTAVVRENFADLSKEQLAAAPVAALQPTAVDLGRVSRSAVVRHSLSLSNTGLSDLQLRRLYATHPALTLACPVKAIKPGKSAVITVTIDTAKAEGNVVNETFEVITNDPAHAVQQVRVVGEIID